MKIRFMAGLPRTGTNLLSSLLRQDPQVYLSDNSSLNEHLLSMDNHIKAAEDCLLGTMVDNHANLMRGAIGAFYSNASADFVIDKSRGWGAPYYLRLLTNVLGHEPLILTPVRPLAEVVASFVYKAQQFPGENFIDKALVNEDFLAYWRKPIDDARVDWLLRPRGMLDYALLSVSSAFNSDTAHMFHVYTYDHLIENTQETINGLYDFIGAERYRHNLKNLSDDRKVNDAEVLGVPGMYEVRPTIAKQSPPPDYVLSQYALERCAIEDFWTDKLGV